MARNFETLNIKFYTDEDYDIIEFLKDKPKAYFIKRALRVYMNDIFEKGVPQQKEDREESKSAAPTKDDDDWNELEGLE